MKALSIATITFLFTLSILFAKAPDRPYATTEGPTFYLGVIVANPDRNMLKEQHLDGGALIIKVFDDSEAQRIGLQEKDIIIKFNGHKIEDPIDLKDVIEDLGKADDVEFTVVRAGKKLLKTAHLEPARQKLKWYINKDEEEPDIDVPQEAIAHMMQAGPSGKGGYLGIEVQNLSEQLRNYFQVKNGVLIERVLEDSPAHKAGLKAGDVIIKINAKTINDDEDLVRTLNFYDPGDNVSVYFARKGKNKEVTVTLAKKRGLSLPWQNRHWNSAKQEMFHHFRGPGHIFFRQNRKTPIFKKHNSKYFIL